MKAKLFVLALVGVLALAGCSAPEETGTSGSNAPTTTTNDGTNGGTGGAGEGTGSEDTGPFRVVSAERRNGGCLFEGAEGTCHVLKVSIDNAGDTRDFDANMFYWSAVTADGQVYKTPEVEGSDAVAGGRTGEITLEFDVDDADARLDTLRYEQLFGDTLSAPVPDY